LPLVLGVLAGAAARERPVHLAVGLALAVGHSALDLPTLLSVLAGTALGVVPLALVVRLAAWLGDGRLIDALCGTVLGAFVGGGIGAILGAFTNALATALLGGGPDHLSRDALLATMGAFALAGAAV